ncbi:uncharacterized protein LOC130749003 [Lotus japonicus]|uniref:uncharacterized protein LOC130749003 n=1 Tax=Lotus japonicus TaxID=34305 RepID=UPI00258329F3|nr:uncharacterized protein LOC130749003 [Lotus japonicus]
MDKDLAGRENSTSADHIYCLKVDGSWNPSTGMMGGAAVLLAPDGSWAELWAVELGLSLAWEMGIRSLSHESDCLQVVNILQAPVVADSFWDRDAILDVRAWFQREWQIKLNSLPREQNNTTDFFARKAAREGTPYQIWRQPPTAVFELLYLDATT